MRSDSIGLFWQDTPVTRGKARISRVMPEIPDTGWVTPTEFPNLAAAKALSFDVETFDPELKTHGPGWARGKGHICGLAVGTPEGHAWYFPMRHTVEADHNLDPQHVLAWARDTLCDHRPKVGANLTYDVGWLREEGVHVRGPLLDVEFAEALLAEEETVNLEDLGQRYLGIGKTTNVLYEWCDAYYGGGTNDQRKNIYRAPPRLVGPYAMGDVTLPFQVLERQWPLLHQQNLLHLFDIECRLIPLMIEMRFAGVSIDLDRAEQMRDRMVLEIEKVDKQIHDLVGFDVNTNAAESIAQAFDVLGLPYGRTAKSGKPSFTKGFLKTVNHPIGDLIREKRKFEKIKGTFIESYLLNSHVNGKVYGSFHQMRGDADGTRSGRFSSSDPNLQNIPSRTQLGKLVRTCFVPDYGHKQWIKADYCVAPKTRILTSDLRWINAEDISVGDEVIAFDEHSSPRRYLHKSKVTGVKRLTQPCYRIKTEKTEIVCSAKHRWLAQTYSRKYAVPSKWVETRNLCVGHRILRVVDSWQEEKTCFELGWLSGVFDGEGWIHEHGVGLGQKEGLVYKRVKDLLKKYGYEFEEDLNEQNKVWRLRIKGGRSSVWRLLGTLRPIRLLPKLVDESIEGSTVTCWLPADTIQEIEYIGEQEVIGFQTEHGTFLAEGLCSHNSQIEYRALAHYAVGPGSDDVRAKYNSDPSTDFHVVVQGLIKEITGQELDRPLVKNVNFGTTYGMGLVGLAEYLKLPVKVAKKLLEAIHKGAPFLRTTMDATMAEADRFGYITTILGRRSRFDWWIPGHFDETAKPLPYEQAILRYVNPKRAYLHKALNRRLQGSAADLIKVAMLMCWEGGIYAETGVPRLTVHDELDFSDPGGKEEAFAEAKRVMETAIPFRVPILVGWDVGPSWGEAE